jgi:hypothetical protein
VALVTFFTQFAVVRIVFGMAAVARAFRFPVLAVCFVTSDALGLVMSTNQLEIG